MKKYIKCKCYFNDIYYKKPVYKNNIKKHLVVTSYRVEKLLLRETFNRWEKNRIYSIK